MVVQKAEFMNGLIKNDWAFISCSYPKMTNSVLKIPVANVCCLITPDTHPGHGRCVTSWKFNCVWFADSTFPKSKSKTGVRHGPRIPTFFWGRLVPHFHISNFSYMFKQHIGVGSIVKVNPLTKKSSILLTCSSAPPLWKLPPPRVQSTSETVWWSF